jgi:hypothetical protein
MGVAWMGIDLANGTLEAPHCRLLPIAQARAVADVAPHCIWSYSSLLGHELSTPQVCRA